MYEQIDFSETDLFKRIEKIGIQKLHIQQRFPHVFDFLATAIQEESADVRNIVEQKVGPLHDHGLKRVYDGIDYSKFREDIDVKKAIEILNWTMLGFGEKGLQQIKSFKDLSDFGEQYLKEWNRYAKILKDSFYK